MKKRSAPAVVFVFLILSLFHIENVFAGAWTLPKHKVWAEQYMVWSYAKDSYNSRWRLTSTQSSGYQESRTQYFTMEPKLEFGVTDWLTALASIEYKEGHYKEYNRPDYPFYWPKDFTVKNHGISAVKFGGRWRLMDKPFVLSTQTKIFIYPGYGINHGDRYSDGPFYNVDDRSNLPSIGCGNDSLEQRIMIGKTFSIPLTNTYKLPCYGGAEAGYVWNNRGVANGCVWFLEGGFWPAPWLLIKSELDSYHSQFGTGKCAKAYGIWRVGGVWQVFGGDSVLRQGGKLFNIELLYGITVWGKNTTAFQEFVCKVQTQF